ncbi:MAG: hypothetical protein VYC39_10620 [Myxococcota bacterium]|nr:hypothetical protein [Myxococcota bacterium]
MSRHILLIFFLVISCSESSAPQQTCVSNSDCSNDFVCIAGICGNSTGQEDVCLNDADCDDGKVCDVANAICIDPVRTCSSDEECPITQRCSLSLGICVTGQRLCSTDMDCPSGLKCDVQIGKCYECQSASDCDPSEQCSGGFCEPLPQSDAGVNNTQDAGNSSSSCTADSDCMPPKEVCENQQCVLGCDEFGGLQCGMDEICDPSTGRCVRPNVNCQSDSECSPPMTVCESGQCVGGCDTIGGLQCTGNTVCDSSTGRCVMGGAVCMGDSDCSPPSTICNRNTGNCEAGCLSTGCGMNEMCNSSTGRCEATMSGCMEDVWEDNDTVSSASPSRSGLSQGYRACSSDDDYYSVNLNQGERMQLLVTFSHAEGDINIQIIDPNGSVVGSANSQSDDEAINLFVNTSGSHYIRVFLNADSGSIPGNDYDLTITTSGGNPMSCPRDVLEPNDSSFSPTVIMPGAYSNLSACVSDDDYYRISLNANERIEFTIVPDSVTEGNIYIDLLDNVGNVIMTDSIAVALFVFHTSSSGGDYFLRVRLPTDAGNSPGNGYTMTAVVTGGMSGPMCSDDTYEENDDRTSASLIFTEIDYSSLVACDMDEDFYRFTSTRDESTVVRLNYATNEGDIDLQIVDSSGSLIAQARTTTDNETIEFIPMLSGNLYLRVWLYQDAGTTPGNQYSMRIEPCEDDILEGSGNNTLSAARLINTGTRSNLKVCENADDHYIVIGNQSGSTLTTQLSYTVGEGDLDLEYIDMTTGAVLASASGSAGQTALTHSVMTQNAIVIRVHQPFDLGPNPGNSYSMTITRQ